MQAISFFITQVFTIKSILSLLCSKLLNLSIRKHFNFNMCIFDNFYLKLFKSQAKKKIILFSQKMRYNNFILLSYKIFLKRFKINKQL